VEVGTAKLVVNEPIEEVVTVAAVCVTPSNLIVTADRAVKPDPVTMTELPTWALTGFSLMEAVTPVAVKVAEALLELPSVAETVFAPAAEAAGTAKLAENVPVDEVVTAEGDVACPVPSYVIVIVDEAAKPEPVTMTDEPVAPLVGFSLIEAVTPVAVKVAEAVLELAPLAVTMLAPLAEAVGTAKLAVNVPVADTLAVPCVIPSYFIDMVSEGAKPVPDTVTVEPTPPEVGLNAIEAAAAARIVMPVAPMLAPLPESPG
jgi:hypothetical protein